MVVPTSCFLICVHSVHSLDLEQGRLGDNYKFKGKVVNMYNVYISKQIGLKYSVSDFTHHGMYGMATP